MARSILFIAQFSPPSNLSAARRTAGLVKYLDRLGHGVTVVTSMASGSGPVPGARRTFRTRDLMMSPLNWRRGNFAAVSGDSGSTYDPSPSALSRLAVPDLELFGWVPFALARATELCKSERFDCVITTSPPQSAHLVGRALQARGLPWVADFRDGWTFDVTREPFPTALQRWLDERIELSTVRSANAVVAVTEPISTDLSRRSGRRVLTITNGFDPEELAADQASWRPPLDDEAFSIVYTGSLGFGGRSPQAFFDAISLLDDTGPDSLPRIEVVIAGPTTSNEIEAAESLGGRVKVLGSLPRDQVLALQRAADALVLFAGDDRPSVATGKLYEYLASRRPVIVVGDGSAAASIVKDCGAGAAVAASDVVGIRDTLAAALTGRMPKPDVAQPETVGRFAYPQIAEQMEGAVEDAISASGV